MSCLQVGWNSAGTAFGGMTAAFPPAVAATGLLGTEAAPLMVHALPSGC